MSRFFLVVLLVVGFVALHPGLRASAAPYAERAVSPLYGYYAGWRVNEIARLLESEVQQGRTIPARAAFTPFLERALLSESAARDPWGTPYYLKAEPFAVRVGSAGPDRKVGTDEDILSRPIGTGRLSHP